MTILSQRRKCGPEMQQVRCLAHSRFTVDGSEGWGQAQHCSLSRRSAKTLLASPLPSTYALSKARGLCSRDHRPERSPAEGGPETPRSSPSMCGSRDLALGQPDFVPALFGVFERPRCRGRDKTEVGLERGALATEQTGTHSEAVGVSFDCTSSNDTTAHPHNVSPGTSSISLDKLQGPSAGTASSSQLCLQHCPSEAHIKGYY